MINTLARIDHVASSGRTVWHRASALGKLLLAGGLVGVAIFSPSLLLLALLHLSAWGLALGSRMPARIVILAAGYPLLFSLLFVVAAWDGSGGTPARLLLRPLTASLVAVWLVGTTPYPDLFAPISRLVPRGVGDGLFLTYRALFELMGRTERLWRALRIRGGSSAPLRHRLALVGEGLGTLVVYGFERSQRLFAAMQLRGHSGRVCGCRHYAETSGADLLVAGAGVVLVAASLLLWRLP